MAVLPGVMRVLTKFQYPEIFDTDNEYLIRGCSSGVRAPVGKRWFLDLSGPSAKATSLAFLQTVIDDVTKQPYLSCLTSI